MLKEQTHFLAAQENQLKWKTNPSSSGCRVGPQKHPRVRMAFQHVIPASEFGLHIESRDITAQHQREQNQCLRFCGADRRNCGIWP